MTVLVERGRRFLTLLGTVSFGGTSSFFTLEAVFRVLVGAMLNLGRGGDGESEDRRKQKKGGVAQSERCQVRSEVEGIWIKDEIACGAPIYILLPLTMETKICPCRRRDRERVQGNDASDKKRVAHKGERHTKIHTSISGRQARSCCQNNTTAREHWIDPEG